MNTRYVSPLEAHDAEQGSGNCLLLDQHMVGVIRLSLSDSSRMYRSLLEEALSDSDRYIAEGRVEEGVCLRLSGGNHVRSDYSTQQTTEFRRRDERTLKQRKEILGSAAYR